jgi:hypothetical protein
MAGIFEDLFPADMTGNIDATVLDPHGITPPTTIIRVTDDWGVHVEWYIDGPAAPLLGGEWTVTVYAESIGAGPEMQLGNKVVDLDTQLPAPPRNYEATINVVAGTLPAGVYRLVSVLNYANMGVPLEIAGFVEGPLVQIYDV